MEDNYQQRNEFVDGNKDHEETKINPINDVVLWKAIILFLVAIVGLDIIATVFSLFAKLIFHTQFADATNNLPFIHKVLGVLQFLTYAVGIGIFFAVIGIPTLKKIYCKFKDVQVYAKGFAYGIILLVAQTVYGIVSTIIFGSVESNENQEALVEMTKQTPILIGICVVIFAPIFEELAYRYALFGTLHKKSRILAYIIGLTIFGLIHFSFDALFSRDMERIKIELINLPSYFICGGILCYAYEKEESLLSSMTAHATNNLIAFIQMMILVYGE